VLIITVNCIYLFTFFFPINDAPKQHA